MTVGENIQKYRKKLGMSQEELGKKLLVSRQTISLWEKDQTSPTIDNLMRLKEVFGVSVDEILGAENNTQIVEDEPNESYKFNFSKTELNEIFSLQRKSVCKKTIVFALILVFLIIFFIASSAPNIMIGLAVGILFVGLVFYIKGICAYSKVWKNSIERICESTYEYKIFEDYITINIYRKGKKIRESKCYFTDIEQMYTLGKWLFFQFGGQSFIVRKSELKGNSFFYSYIYKNPAKTIEQTAPGKWRILSIILFVASLLSILGALALSGVISSVNNLFLVENMWLFFLLTPIPIASAVLGFVLKAKGYKYKKNIILGIIMTVLLCIYGSFTFIFTNEYSHSDESIIRTEQLTGIDIPEHKQINTQDWTEGKQSVSRGYIYYISDVYFDNGMVKEFEKQIITDDKWLASIPNDLIGITPPFSGYGIYDSVLIYNTDTSEYNALPNDSGTFRFINILYRTEDNQMKIIEYDIDYVK